MTQMAQKYSVNGKKAQNLSYLRLPSLVCLRLPQSPQNLVCLQSISQSPIQHPPSVPQIPRLLLVPASCRESPNRAIHQSPPVTLQIASSESTCYRWSRSSLPHPRLCRMKRPIPLHGNFGNQEMPNYFQLSSKYQRMPCLELYYIAMPCLEL